ncbi:hypothetical protein ALI22I_01700 [Saccharothrix sp. ALI-22-I]|uniref:ferredoxin n=1 Tax=Saccharothrix sp. ALI-22-I TaxID=1933778 RepID=UPI00097C73B5|nr:ferredoxin [Saccharothrix sp. ALI-22-I]ONI92830.1 hypothetical protein ALI22I_01700 [Saccharothrix sp. ALI-22-I]
MRAHLAVDKAECQGSGLCHALAPELFRLDEQGFGEAAVSDLDDPEDIEAADSVVGGCPAAAVLLTYLD